MRVDKTVLSMIREGLRHAEFGDYEGAARAFRRAVEREPKLPRARFCLGAALYHLGDMDGALVQWREVEDVTPDYAQVAKWIDAAEQAAAD